MAGLTPDEHRDIDRQALLELRLAVEELAQLAGVTLNKDLAPRLFAALKSPGSACGRLAAFDAELEAGRRWELGRSQREHEIWLRDQRVLAEEARRRAEEAPPKDSMGFPVDRQGRPLVRR